MDDTIRHLARISLAAVLVAAGVAHFMATEAFSAQVPFWMPWPRATIYISGVIEIGLGLALLLAQDQRRTVGLATAAFFVLIFPGNISQWMTQTAAFGLDTDAARFVRLLFQPVLVIWALWCTRAVSRQGVRGRAVRATEDGSPYRSGPPAS